MIEFQHVTKQYGDKIALNDLNLQIKNGEIFGLIGHNGAGKSTTIKSLVSVINPTHCEILVDGQNLAENRLAIKKKIGYVPDSPDMFLALTAREYWNMIAAAYELDQQAKQSRLTELLNLFDLSENIDEVIGGFSHGMRQKTFLIGALLPDPEIWILDEPMTGLDPQAAFDLKEMMKSHAAKGNTVIFSTHVLEVAQRLCDELAILKKGEMIYNGTLDSLLAQHPGESLETVYLNLAGKNQTETPRNNPFANEATQNSGEAGA